MVEVEVHDAENFERYRAMVPATLEPYGGRFLVRGGDMVCLEGDWNPPRFVVLEFASMERAQAWHASTEYREARTLRHQTAHSRMIAVDGVE